MTHNPFARDLRTKAHNSNAGKRIPAPEFARAVKAAHASIPFVKPPVRAIPDVSRKDEK